MNSFFCYRINARKVCKTFHFPLQMDTIKKNALFFIPTMKLHLNEKCLRIILKIVSFTKIFMFKKFLVTFFSILYKCFENILFTHKRFFQLCWKRIEQQYRMKYNAFQCPECRLTRIFTMSIDDIVDWFAIMEKFLTTSLVQHYN